MANGNEVSHIRELLHESYENYRCLKKHYDELKGALLKERRERREEDSQQAKRALLLQRRAHEMQSHFRSCMEKISREQSRRERLFDEFKSKTMAQVTTLYERQIELMGRELDAGYATMEGLCEANSRLEEEARRVGVEKRALMLKWRAKEAELARVYEEKVFQLKEKVVEMERRVEMMGHQREDQEDHENPQF